ncbi:MAG TPA: DEAD/DEAH box helicase [Candidatus Xenobia bacterium]|jgi:superfamily II DNA or RNA helicase
MHATEPLTRPQQLVLELLALAGYAIVEETLQKLVTVVSKEPFEIRSHLKNLQHLRLVGTGPNYGSWVLAAEVADMALRMAVKDGLADPVLEALQRLEPHRHKPPQTMLRLATYRRDWAEVARIEQKYLYHAAPILADALANPFEPEWFEGMPPKLREQTLTIMLANGLTRFTPLEGVLEYALVPPVPDSVLFFGSQVLFRQGRFEAYEKLVTSTHHWWTPAHRGALAFLHGDDAAAEPLFAESLEKWRTGTGRRKAMHSDENMIFYFLCLLRQRKYAEIKSLARGITKEDPYRIALLLIRDVAERELGARETDPPREWEARGHTRATQFVYMLHQAWTDEPIQEDWLVDFEKAAEQAGFTFWVEEAKATRNRTPGHLIDCLRRSEPWEQVMAGLEELASTLQPVDKAARLVWILGGELTAREQRSDKTGWNKGKPVGFKTLHDKHATMAYLTPQDHLICSAIVREGASYRLDMTKALPAIVGHPFVFNEDGTLLDIVSSPPELSIQQEKGGLRIRMMPPWLGNPVEFIRDTPTRFRVVVYSPQHQKLGQLIRHGVQVPAAAAPRLAQLGTAVSGLVTVHSDLDVGVGATEVPWDAALRAVLVPFGIGLKLHFTVQPLGPEGPTFKPGQGGDVVVAEVGGRRVQTRRDRDDERRRLLAFVESCSVLTPGPVEWMLEEFESCLDLLQQLSQAPDIVVQWPQGQKFKLVGQASSSNLSMNIARSKDWFALEGGVRVDETRVVQISELLKQVRTGRFVKLSDTEFLALTEEFRRRLLELAHYAEVQRNGVRVHPLAAGAVEPLAREAGSIQADESWKVHVARLERPHVPEVPGTLQAELRPYQVDGYRWLSRLAAWGVGACLADDMGLGKTLQALAVMVERAPQGPTLVVAPASVALNWMAEARRFAPTLRLRLYSEEDRKAPFDPSPFDLVVCTYGLLFQDRERLAAVSWTTLVLDEAQAIKNQGTRRSQAAKALTAGFRVVTTGTPVENHLAELWNLFDFLNPGLLGSMDSFHRRFATPITRVQDPDARHALRTLIAPFVLRRTKAQVLSELPPRTDMVVHVELDESERGLYESLRKDALERLHMKKKERREKDLKFQILAELTKLRRACCHPRLVLPSAPLISSKLAAFGEILDELLDNRHKALVFSQFVDHLSLVREYLDGRGVHYQYLDGSTPLPARQQAVEAFQAGHGDLFLISLRAGGTGLNLTAADYVIHMDPWWNPAVEDQASDRAHRIGQQRPVTVYRMVTRGTIEEGIVGLHAEKRELADALLEGTEMSAALSADDLLHLISDSSF